MRIKDLSIRTKLIGIQLFTVVLALVLGSLALIYVGVKGLKESRLANLSSLSQVVAFNCIAPLEFMDENSGADVLASLREEASISHAVIYDSDDELFATYAAPNTNPFDFSGENRIATGTHIFFDEYLLLSRAITVDEESIGTLYIRSDLRELRNANADYVIMVMLVLVISVVVAALIAVLFQRSISQPIKMLVDKINLITETGSYGTQAKLDRKDELGVLSTEFEDMLEVIRKKEEELNRLNGQLEKNVAARTAELQEAYAQLRERAEELREVTYVISHDLQTPLRGISSLAYFLREDLDATASLETKEHLKLLSGRVERMHRLTQALINYVEAGRSSVQVAPVNLKTMIHNLLESFSESHVFEYDIQDGLPVLQADPGRLFRVFSILVENALLHCDKPTAKIEITATEEGEGWKFIVQDNGPGIEPIYHEKIFAMFQTLELKDKVGTIGAGLSIAKKIVEEAGGSIGVESPADGGAIFWFRWRGKAIQS